ncbi:MAG: gluconate 2-dehydrogenase subunit 3 family protein [Alphaproteobacteria bacterium]|nr:gluconate 2-dehydrogenase subunit 3 family protein [Alphaproteobacteria bacterium]
MSRDSASAGRGVDRRHFVAAAGAAGFAGALPAGAPALAQHGGHGAAPARAAASPPPAGYVFFMPPEARFVEAAVDVFIPHDDVGPGGVEAGVPAFIDRQLAGAFGRGAGLYLQGPFADGAPTQGYQLPLTPAEFYRAAIREIDELCRREHDGKRFDELPAATRDAVLLALREGRAALATLPGATFVALLLQNAIEGYFADPIYGGNRDMGAWRMIGFPGVGGMYATAIEEHRNAPMAVEFRSIADMQR